MIQIKSYSDINGVSFGSIEADIVRIFGEPRFRRLNSENEQELHFDDFIVRFDSNETLLREFTLLPKCEAAINEVPVEWAPSFLREVQQDDPDLVEVLGFIVSLKLGVAFSGFHDGDDSQMAIHAFNRGDWDMFKSRMKAFQYNG